MKVVLFCGGLGLRMREASERIPKPMVPVGNRPILWHVMKYYAHFGHKDFVICLGHRAEVIKSYFLEYDETVSNNFVFRGGGRQVELLTSDIDDWTITFVDTGLSASVGERLRAVREFVDGDELFLANYGDVLTDAPLPGMIDDLVQSDCVASMLCVRPAYTFHLVSVDGNVATGIEDVTRADLWINGGYFVLRSAIFEHINEGEDLVIEPFQRLIERRQLIAHRYDGFWAPMDTLKDKTRLDSLIDSGSAPWRVWENGAQSEAGPA